MYISVEKKYSLYIYNIYKRRKEESKIERKRGEERGKMKKNVFIFSFCTFEVLNL